MDISAIAAASIDMSMSQVQQQASVSVAKKAMGFQETQAAQVLDMLNDIPAPVSYGHQLDVRV